METCLNGLTRSEQLTREISYIMAFGEVLYASHVMNGTPELSQETLFLLGSEILFGAQRAKKILDEVKGFEEFKKQTPLETSEAVQATSTLKEKTPTEPMSEKELALARKWFRGSSSLMKVFDKVKAGDLPEAEFDSLVARVEELAA